MKPPPPRRPIVALGVGRLTLPPGQATAGLCKAVAVALTREIADTDRRQADPTVADAIAQAIAGHPTFAAAISSDLGEGR